GSTAAALSPLLCVSEAAQLDWAVFCAFSREDGTYAAGLDGAVADHLVAERLLELSELQDRITADRRAALLGRQVDLLVDATGVARSHREAPEIDGIVTVPDTWGPGSFVRATVVGAAGPDLEAA